MYLTYVCIVLALLSNISSDAFPIYIDDTSESIINDPYFQRKEVFDPYGFNSILTRYVDRDGFDNGLTKRTVRILDPNDYDYI